MRIITVLLLFSALINLQAWSIGESEKNNLSVSTAVEELKHYLKLCASDIKIDGKSAVAGAGVEGKDAKSVVGGMNGENHRLNDEVRRVVGEILDVCEGTFLNLSAVLALRICEDTIPHKCYGGACVGACA